ncbi:MULTISPECIES: sensor histidine kinase [Enterobacterales]|jgi:Histidine kinase-, DNA gyrase B-, and HSP90-like ATPase.|uniref:sensor histidine kinase n=1 Tax=Enterobacterales TaxID=91347 RepID=UPI001CBD5C93|nr:MULTISPECIES: ATP-binding protein [Enterobacterales]MBZ7421908.1 HAMP domain-containing histidine kinase [Klebsiella michiganensis]
MKNDEILNMLNSVSPKQRYDVAKYLAGNQLPLLEINLRTAYEKETVGYIKKTLDLAISRLQQSTVKNEVNDDEVPQNHQVSYQNGMNEMASMFLHELESVVGRIAYTAKNEIKPYDISETKKHIEMLRSVIEAITQIKEASKSKNTEEVNIHEFINNLIHSAYPNNLSEIRLSGNFGINCICDKNLLKLAITNGIRNAIESCLEFDKETEISIWWGETNVDWFISIMDNGIGITLPVEQLMKKKVTTKNNHLGYGLLIITKAMERLDGHWTLENDAAEGANLTLRWNK